MRHAFTFDVDDFRMNDIPGLGNAKLGTCFVRADVLVRELDLDAWMQVNPRIPNRTRTDVPTGGVVRDIWDTLEHEPELFALKNQGIFILVEGTPRYTRAHGKGRLTLWLTDKQQHGLCNGGHTYHALRAYADRDPAALERAWVRLHLYSNVAPEYVPRMAEGLNTSRQVDESSLLHLSGAFNELIDAMEGKQGQFSIAYHQGDMGEVYVADVIRYLLCFDAARYADGRHPTDLYRQTGRMMQLFDTLLKETPDEWAKIVPHAHDILMLRDLIVKQAPLSTDFAIFRSNAGTSSETALPFIGERVHGRLHNGWVLPMLAAFRANVEWGDGRRKVFEWRTPIDTLFFRVIRRLVGVCVEAHKRGIRPQDMARDAEVYAACYGVVERAIEHVPTSR